MVLRPCLNLEALFPRGQLPLRRLKVNIIISEDVSDQATKLVAVDDIDKESVRRYTCVVKL